MKKLNLKNFLLFTFFGVSLAFPLGLLMLTVGPTRMIANKAAQENWSHENENLVQKITLVLFCITIGIIAFYITRFFITTANKTTKNILLFISSIAFIISLYIFTFKPLLLISQDSANNEINKSATAEFHFGPYPDEDKIEELKAEGYTAVIPLLHELVVPAEPMLLNDEIKNAKKHNLKLISVPMLPWIVENDESVAKIKKLAHELKGKYYVHCYLGRDRANVFRNIITNENSNVKFDSKIEALDIETKNSFERGKIIKLEDGIYLTPYPTDEEFFAFILNGKIKNVVSLLDKTNNENKKNIDREEKIMKQYNQSFYHYSINEKKSKADFEEIITKISKLEKPVIIHDFKTDSEMTKKFSMLYKSKIKQ